MHRKFNALGYAFTRTNTRVVYKDAHDKTLAEVDVLLENGTYALAVEVKTELTVEDVKVHAERMAVLRAYADRHNDARQYLGAVAGGIVSEQARDYAYKSGFYVLEQSGDTVRIAEPPEAWQPNTWQAFSVRRTQPARVSCGARVLPIGRSPARGTLHAHQTYLPSSLKELGRSATAERAAPSP